MCLFGPAKLQMEEEELLPSLSLSSARYQHCVVVLEDNINVLTGGQQGKGKLGEALSLVERYSFAGSLIQSLPSLNQAR